MKDKIGYIIGFILLLSFFIWMANDYNNRKNSMQEVTKTINFFNTEITIKIYTKDKGKATTIIKEISNIYSDYNNLASRDSYSNIKNIYYLNHTNIGDITKVDERLYNLIKYGKEVYTLTSGYININMGNINDIWSNYYDKGIPTDDELKNKIANIENIVLLDDNKIENKGFNIDLSEIIRIYVTNLAKEYLEKNGFLEYMMNIDDSTILGNHYNNLEYKVGLLSIDENSVSTIVKGSNMAIITINNQRNNYEYSGVNYHSIINPKTLYPSTANKSVTIITKDFKNSEIIATTLFMMNVENGKKFLLNFPGTEAMWYTSETTILKTDLFSSYEE